MALQSAPEKLKRLNWRERVVVGRRVRNKPVLSSGQNRFMETGSKSQRPICSSARRNGWDRLPWHGPEVVGKYLAELCGGRPIKPDPDAGGKPTRRA